MGFFNREKLFVCSIDVNNHGELSFTNLAFKLLKIVMLSSSNDFFFYFEVNPLGKAIQVNCSARSHTNTWIEQKVFVIFSLFETDFALRLFITIFCALSWFFFKRVVFHNISAGVNSGFIFAIGSGNFTINASLADEEFDSTQFDNLSRFEFVAQVFSIFFFKFTNDKISLLFSFSVTGVGFIGIESLIFIVLFLSGTWRLRWEVEFNFLVSYWLSSKFGQELELRILIFIRFRLFYGDNLKALI